ncbi:MAG: hypothetical protein ACLTW9_17320 [Enterocloster sp.]
MLASLSRRFGTDDVQQAHASDTSGRWQRLSVKKYQAMRGCAVWMTKPGTARLLQFYGSLLLRGEWAGRLVQVQNPPPNYIDSLDTARALVQKQK